MIESQDDGIDPVLRAAQFQPCGRLLKTFDVDIRICRSALPATRVTVVCARRTGTLARYHY